MTNPYTEKEYTKHGTFERYIVRTFSDDVNEEELIWHKDRQNRTIHILSGSEWKIQLEDNLPLDLEIGKEYYIPKETYHRVIKGKGDLIVRFPII
jgi:hypothetical protein